MPINIPILTPDKSQFELIASLAPKDVNAVWVDSKKSIAHQKCLLKDAVAIVITPSQLSLELVSHCPNLQLVQVCSAGTDLLDVRALRELGIKVANCGDANAVAVAEHTIALMLSVYRKLKLQFESVKAREWVGEIRAKWLPSAHELSGKTIGIIGLGRIGQQVAKRLQGWQCTLLYTDISTFPTSLERELNVTNVSQTELLQTSDIVTLHVPLMGKTKAIISARELELMKSTAVIINASRGEVILEKDLVWALNHGHIAGAGLDVLEQEPTSADNPLIDMDNVVITPHLGSFAIETLTRTRSFAIQNASTFVKSGELKWVVLPE